MFAVAAPGAARADGAAADDVGAAVATAARPSDAATFSVMRWQNRTAIRGLDWLELALPFVLAERLERHVGARAGYDRWVIPRAAPRWSGTPETTPEAVWEHAQQTGASWVFSGWMDGTRERLELSVTLWQIERSAAAGADPQAAGEATLGATEGATGGAIERRVEGGVAPVEAVMRLAGEAGLSAAVETMGLTASALSPADKRDREQAMTAPVSDDFYAFTLFGRGLVELAAAVGGDAGVRYRLRRAARELSRSVLIDPGLAAAQRLLGEIKLALGQRDDARGHLEAALRLAPRYVAAMASRAELALADGDDARAVALHRAILEARPWDMERRFALGRLLWEQGELEGAREALSEVVAAVPEHAPPHLAARRMLVEIYARRGQQDALLAELEAVLALRPNDTEARFDLAAVYLAVGRVDDGEAIYDALAESVRVPAAMRARAHKFLGDRARRRGALEGALDRYQRALAATPDDPQHYFLVATMHLVMGDDEAAQRVLRRALRFRAELAEVHAALGAIAYGRGRHSEAVWHLRRSVYKQPRNGSYHYNLALALSALGDAQAALYELRVGLRHAPGHVGLHYLRGVVSLRLNKPAEARGWFESALRLDPGHADARHNLRQLDAAQP
ncbi:MAG: hypothetical protein Tsb0020_12410 [Haliangiales bacterium]